MLVSAQLAQGAGAAIMLPASLALIREACTDAAMRARAIAVWAIGGAVASAAGPVKGGFLILLSWRMIVFINIPVGVVALLLLTRVPRSPRRAVPFDWAGQVAAVAGLGALIFGLIEGAADGFGSPEVVGSLAIAAAALTGFLILQSRGILPMVPLELFRSRPVAVSVSVGFAFMVGFYGLVFLLSLYLQEHRGLSPLETGLAFLPMTALTAFVNPVLARIAERFGPRVPIAAGQFLMAMGLMSVCLAVSGASVALLSMLTIPVGIGGMAPLPLASQPTSPWLRSTTSATVRSEVSTLPTMSTASNPGNRACHGAADKALTRDRARGGNLAICVGGGESCARPDSTLRPLAAEETARTAEP